jgi:hypothetical protein
VNGRRRLTSFCSESASNHNQADINSLPSWIKYLCCKQLVSIGRRSLVNLQYRFTAKGTTAPDVNVLPDLGLGQAKLRRARRWGDEIKTPRPKMA